MKAARRGNRVVAAVGALVAAAAVTAGVAGLLGAFTPADAPRDLRGNPVQVEADATPRPEASAVASGQGRFVAASVGLDVPLGALDPVDGVVVPSGYRSAYLVRNAGVPLRRASTGTVYVAMHALRNGYGPGNALFDGSTAAARIEKGAPIVVGGVRYVVTGSKAVPRGELAARSWIWAAKPGRLVVITCLERSGGRGAVDNLVIEAQEAGAQA